MNKNWVSAIFPHALVVLGLIIISIIYTLPALEGKKLRQEDSIQSTGAGQELLEYKEETGKRALWTNSMFGGMPAFFITMDYPMSIATKLGRAITYFLFYPTNLIFLYLLGCYVMFLLLGYNLWLSLLASLAFAFTSYNIINIEAGHVSKVVAIGLTPPFIGAVILTYQGKYLKGAALSALFGGIHLYGNHIQVTYYVLIALVMYVVYEVIVALTAKQQRNEKLKNVAIASAYMAVAAVLCVGMHASRLWTNYEYNKQTIRGKSELTVKDKEKESEATDRSYAFQWSYGKMETFTLLIPNFYGGGNIPLTEGKETMKAVSGSGLPPAQAEQIIGYMQRSGIGLYWGNQPFTMGPAYAGAIICFLFVFSILIVRNPIKWWLLSVITFFIMISWGKNFEILNNFLFDALPIYNKFRTHTMILSLIQLFMVWMIVLGLKEIFDKEYNKEKTWKAFKISVGVVGGLALFFAVLGSGIETYKSTNTVKIAENGVIQERNVEDLFTENLSKAIGEQSPLPYQLLTGIRKDRAALQTADAWRSFIFIALGAAVLGFYLAGQLNFISMMSGLLLLILIDLWAVDRRYLNDEDFVSKSELSGAFDTSPADRQIKEDNDLHFRVWNTAYNPAGNFTSSAIPSYHHSSLGGYHGAKLRRYQDVLDSSLNKRVMSVYDMLNTKYFILSQDGELKATQNPNAMGNAWFVKGFKLVKNADEEINAVKTEFDPKRITFIDQKFEAQVKGLKIKSDPKAKIRLIKYAPDELVYESETNSKQLAVFSEIYYVQEGKIEWKAYIDGKEVPHLRANYILRGLVTPPGKHTITFKFEVPVYKTGEIISLISSLLTVIALALVILKTVRKKKETE